MGKMNSIIICIDNGVSGSISIKKGDDIYFFITPVKKCLDYTKKKKFLNRLDIKNLDKIFNELNIFENKNIKVFIERPMINFTRFNASISAIRCFEALIVYLESKDLSYEIIDSKEWQRYIMPKNIKGNKELKICSLELGNRYFPEFKDNKLKDRDSLLMLKYILEKKGVNL